MELEEEEFREAAETVWGWRTLSSLNCPWISKKRRNPSPVLSREGNTQFWYNRVELCLLCPVRLPSSAAVLVTLPSCSFQVSGRGSFTNVSASGQIWWLAPEHFCRGKPVRWLYFKEWEFVHPSKVCSPDGESCLWQRLRMWNAIASPSESPAVWQLCIQKWQSGPKLQGVLFSIRAPISWAPAVGQECARDETYIISFIPHRNPVG